jgi:hypothetical protein
MLFQKGENNPEAMDDLRNYLHLCSVKSQQVVLHDMLEKRYSIRPYGWPEDEVLLLLARLVVLSEVTLIMDSTAIPVDKVYEAITTPAKRRKIIVRKREISDPKAIQNARSLGKELFAEMGPDGEDGLFSFLQTKLRSWQSSLTGYKQLADTKNYPGSEEIDAGLSVIAPLLADKDGRKFIERFNTVKQDLLDLSDNFHDLEHFYEHQKPSWEKLRKAYDAFKLNQLDLERDTKAAPALRRMHQILTAKAPYSLIKEAESLISTVQEVNSSLLEGKRSAAALKIDAQVASLRKDIDAASGPIQLRTTCLAPLEELCKRISGEQSLAHISQIEFEAIAEYDKAIAKLEAFCVPTAPKPDPAPEPDKVKEETTNNEPVTPVVRKQRVIKPAELMTNSYLESAVDVAEFLDVLKKQLDSAISNNERIQIR